MCIRDRPIISLISVWIVISGFVTGSKGDVFVVRTSKPVETSEKMGYFDLVTVSSLHILYTADQETEGSQDCHFVPRSPFWRRAVRQRGYDLRLLIFKTANLSLSTINEPSWIYCKWFLRFLSDRDRLCCSPFWKSITASHILAGAWPSRSLGLRYIEPVSYTHLTLPTNREV